MFKQPVLKQLGLLPVLATVTLAGLSPLMAEQPGLAQSTTKYFCDTSGRVPATVAQTARGKVKVVSWNTTLGGGQFDPVTRCQQVSARFQTLSESKMLRFITTGRQNGQNIICVAAERNGGCLPNGNGLLFTLRPGANPRATLQQMVNISRMATSGPIMESSQQRLYVNMDELLQNAATEPNTTAAP
jgi:Circadian oscillating protein COP23